MLHAIWLTSDNSSKSGLDDTIARLYMSALTGMSSQLADSLVTFDIPLLVTASGILWQVCYFNYPEVSVIHTQRPATRHVFD